MSRPATPKGDQIRAFLERARTAGIHRVRLADIRRAVSASKGAMYDAFERLGCIFTTGPKTGRRGRPDRYISLPEGERNG